MDTVRGVHRNSKGGGTRLMERQILRKIQSRISTSEPTRAQGCGPHSKQNHSQLSKVQYDDYSSNSGGRLQMTQHANTHTQLLISIEYELYAVSTRLDSYHHCGVFHSTLLLYKVTFVK